MRLEGRNVLLLPIDREVDIENIVRWRNQPFVRDNFIYRELFTVESQKRWIETMVDTGRVSQFVIYAGQNKKAIGSVYLRDIDRQNEKAEYGIFIGEEDYLGRGYGSEAARLMIRYGFEKLRLHKIFLRVFATNSRALGSYRKAGFKEEARFKEEVKIEGQYYDIVFMAIRKDEFDLINGENL